MTLGAAFLALSGIGLVLGAFALLSGRARLTAAPSRPAESERSPEVRPSALSRLAAFVTAFGITGFLVSHLNGAIAIVTIPAAIAAGVCGAWISTLLPPDAGPAANAETCRPSMVGTVGRLSLPIREGGHGELMYSADGTPRICAARSESGCTIDKGSEVIVTRYDDGTAIVRPVEDILPGVRHAMRRMERSDRLSLRS